MAEVIAHYDFEVHMAVVSEERIREELLKCFKHDTAGTLKKLWQFPFLMDYVFRTKQYLVETNSRKIICFRLGTGSVNTIGL